MRRHIIAVLGLGVFLLSFSAFAEKDTEVDPMHHKLEFENNCVRVVRATFDPGEKSVAPFDAQAAVFISLTEAEPMRINLPDGNFVLGKAHKPGDVGWLPPGRIQPENISKTRIEFVVVEPKGCKK